MNTHVYGIHAVESLLTKRPQDIISAYVQLNTHNTRTQQLITNLNTLDLPIHYVTDKQLQKLCQQHDPSNDNKKNVFQGIVVVAKENKALDENQLKIDARTPIHEPQLWIVLDGIRDPQNFGSILRNAESCRCNGVIMLNHHSAPLNQTVRKIASGATEFINIYQVSNLARTLLHLQKNNIWCIALEEAAKNLKISVTPPEKLNHDNKPAKNTTPIDSSHNLFSLDLRSNIAFVLGSEGTGLRKNTLKHCDQKAYIPMLGHTQSLNVTHAATVALFEVMRQRASFS